VADLVTRGAETAVRGAETTVRGAWVLVLNAFEETGRFFIMLQSVLHWTSVTLRNWGDWLVCAVLRRPRPRVFEARESLESMSSAGVNSIMVALVTAMFTGMVLALQTGITLDRKMAGISSYLGGMVAVSMVRELGPVLTALIVTGRVGSAFAAEIGTMRVTEQIDALETLATNPVRYLVVPRVVACVSMLPILTLFSDIIGVFGGFLVALTRFGQSASLYADNALSMVELSDLFSGLTKSLFFGFIIATVSCYKGFTTAGGAEGVGRATTSAVVVSSMGILIADYFLTAAMSVF
jgi:phospholipid/cholesterol/gamma-HCH transport system permease protein